MSYNARRTAKRDANHSEIEKRFIDLFCSVVDTSNVGGGFPDLVVGCSNRTLLVEIKMPNGTLEPSQVDFIRKWRGATIHIVRTVESVDELVAYFRQPTVMLRAKVDESF